MDSDAEYPIYESRSELWLRLALGLMTIGIAMAALVWPELTVRVVGILFGVNLLVTGLLRTALCLAIATHPPLYRAMAVIFGLLTAALGAVCLRNVAASALLLVLVVGIGWILGGMTDLAFGAVADRDPLRGWRFGIGVAAVLAAIAVLTWPALTLDSFVTIAAIFFMVISSAEIAVACWGLRRRNAAAFAAADGIQP
jgi:uncharacterized membrane protein HdeD (DUF308 family)